MRRAPLPRLINNTALWFFRKTVHSRSDTHTQSRKQAWSQGEHQLKSWQIFVHYVKTVMTQENSHKTKNSLTAGFLRGDHVDSRHVTWQGQNSLEKFHHQCFIIWSESVLRRFSMNLSMNAHKVKSRRRHSTVQSFEMLLSMVLKRFRFGAVLWIKYNILGKKTIPLFYTVCVCKG